MRQQVAQELCDRGRMNWMQDDFDRASADYTSIIETYSDNTDPHMRREVEAAPEWVSKFAN